jgi:hypothetical protein
VDSHSTKDIIEQSAWALVRLWLIKINANKSHEQFYLKMDKGQELGNLMA